MWNRQIPRRLRGIANGGRGKAQARRGWNRRRKEVRGKWVMKTMSQMEGKGRRVKERGKGEGKREWKGRRLVGRRPLVYDELRRKSTEMNCDCTGICLR